MEDALTLGTCLRVPSILDLRRVVLGDGLGLGIFQPLPSSATEHDSFQLYDALVVRLSSMMDVLFFASS